MNLKRLHLIAGLVLSVFIVVHLLNHLLIFFGEDVHIQIMNALRIVYRNIVVESLLLIVVVFQVYSGISLFKRFKGVFNTPSFLRLQLASGLYIAFFLTMHVSAVLFGRSILNVDTNLYFGASVLNTFPYCLFFIPYYFLAVSSVFGHLSAAYFMKSKKSKIAAFILYIGVVISMLIIIGMYSVEIPTEYQNLYNI